LSDVLSKTGEGFEQSLLMAYEVWWALVLGFAISAMVQAWAPRERIQSALSGSGPRPIAWATGLGAASSSCSYAAIAIAKSLFQKGASAASALAFQFASTNLVWELGLVLWILIGWQFALAEYIGGIVMIVLMAVALRWFVSPRLEEQARRHAQQVEAAHQHQAVETQLSWRERLFSASAWSDVAHNFRADWQMLWKEITIGFLLAGFIGLLGNDFFNGLFIQDAPPALETIENVIVGPLIAVLSFVCSIGNVPLAAVLWSGGISFAGVMAFIFADLIVLPIISAYRKYYGWAFALRITALMFVSMVIAALVVDGLFSTAGLIPTGPRPSRDDIFGSVELDYKLVLNGLAAVAFAALFYLTMRRGATDPVCGMKVDRAKALQLERARAITSAPSTACAHSSPSRRGMSVGRKHRTARSRMPTESGGDGQRYIPALRFHALTALFDPVVRLTLREQEFKNRLLNQAKPSDGQRILDVGCGTGTLTLLVKERAAEAEVVGLDADPEILERARIKARKAGLEVRFDRALATELPYEDASFDLVLSTLFFHHLTGVDKRRTAAEIARVLKPGGELHVADMGGPADPVMKVLFFSTVRLIDGLEQTRDNAAGALPAIFEAGGLDQVTETDRLRTVLGSLALYRARKSAAATAPSRPPGG
jgi:ubiquinone/menaquinone biosynthesis C-methylase UbiE/uncharacterized membrane protein YraQ (UPF0718 family)